MLVYNETEPKKGKLKYGRRNIMDKFFTDLMEFLANIEKVVNEVFRIVGEIMKKVDAINAEDAE